MTKVITILAVNGLNYEVPVTAATIKKKKTKLVSSTQRTVSVKRVYSLTGGNSVFWAKVLAKTP